MKINFGKMNFEDKAYNFKFFEEKILNFWLSNNFYSPEYKNDRKETFCITLPPPNANSPLHLGTMSGNTVQDILGRYNRMLGKKVLLVPGKDHAAIQTEVIFEKHLLKEGIRKRDLTREDFLSRCFDFCMTNANIARDQEKKIGLSADFTREKFTLDKSLTNVVYETFIQMYKDGLIHRDKRIINWCPRCETALSDIDTEYKEEKGILYYIKYGDLVIATTRPETKMADSAIAINPKDKRYKHLLGKTIHIESVEGERTLPVIADYLVDKDFGTGILKVTPGHSKDDFVIGERHNLPIISVIDMNGRSTFGKYKGMKIRKAREEIVKDLYKLDLIEKQEDIVHNVQVCERCKSTIEPLISYQWFLRTKDLAKKSIEKIELQEIKIYPQRQEKNLIRWLENIEDWCISRQQWWGQRIPIYYCGGKETIVDNNGDIQEKMLGCGEIIASITPPKTCPKCKSNKIIQDEDIFDTWFSSCQWPYTALGGVNSEDFKMFYPANVMETGRDILFFWVARMIILNIYKTENIPFRNVYLHGLILDREGKKQSKSRGNGIDPSSMIDQFGTDALRLALVSGIAPDQDTKLYNEKIQGFRNFINKIYNSSRFIFLQMQDLDEKDREFIRENTGKYCIKSKVNIQKELLDLKHMTHSNFKSFDIGITAHNLQNFYHHTYCDSYLEDAKNDKSIEAKAELIYTFYTLIKLMHPFVPFITELIFQNLKEENLIKTKEESIMYETV
ncbi:valine--tRNA ligase [Patescibacteria group bacterium]|nr:valine--tRNA ligase [Patescibacteria group bacterium]